MTMNNTASTAAMGIPRPQWQEAIAVVAYPASFLFAITAFLWASTNGYPKWVRPVAGDCLCSHRPARAGTHFAASPRLAAG
jgi:hypothetical protein